MIVKLTILPTTFSRFALYRRNLSKQVDEAGLKKMLVKALQVSLTNNRVSSKDVTNALKSSGLPDRECIGEAGE